MIVATIASLLMVARCAADGKESAPALDAKPIAMAIEIHFSMTHTP
jgi:hypothetical protein